MLRRASASRRSGLPGWFLFLLLMGPGRGHGAGLEIIPPAPRYQETVVARIVFPEGVSPVIYGGTARMAGNTITVTYYSYPDISKDYYDVTLGQLPAGDYLVRLEDGNSGSILASASFTVASSAIPVHYPGSGAPGVPPVNFSGQWWSVAEPGWGLAITQGPTNVVWAEWFTYDATGAPTWYTLEPGAWTRTVAKFVTYSGVVARYKGSYWAGAYGAQRDRTVEGTGKLTFTDAFNGTLDFTANGVRIIKPITRLPIE